MKVAERLSRAAHGGFYEQLARGLADIDPDDGALQLWRSARALDDLEFGQPPAAGQYLRSLELPSSPSLRGGLEILHPESAAIPLPTLLGAIVRADRTIIAVVTQLLTHRGGIGNAPKRSPRWKNLWIVGNPGAGAVRLAPAEPVMRLAISIEAGLAVQKSMGATWCVIEPERLGRVWLSDVVRSVVICAERDTPKEVLDEARRAHSERGRRVPIELPPDGAATWLDALRAKNGKERR